MPFGVRGILYLKTFTACTLPLLKFFEIRSQHPICFATKLSGIFGYKGFFFLLKPGFKVSSCYKASGF